MEETVAVCPAHTTLFCNIIKGYGLVIVGAAEVHHLFNTLDRRIGIRLFIFKMQFILTILYNNLPHIEELGVDIEVITHAADHIKRLFVHLPCRLGTVL